MRGIARATIITIIAVIVVLAGITGYLTIGMPRPTTSTPTITKTATTPTITKVTVILPDGVGSKTSLNFEPARITVVIGVNNSVHWVDQDPIPHTVTSTDIPSGAKSFDSGTINKGDTFDVTLTVPGTYKYFCTLHPSWMRATIIVKS